VSHSFGCIPRSGIAGSYADLCLDLCRSLFPISSPTPVVGGVFDDQATIFIQIPRVGNLEGVALLGKERGL
jgi:hypothetical protein